MLLQISKSIKDKQFEIAQKYISWDDSSNYFNRWTIKLIQAYDLAKQNDLSWLQQARLLISQSNQDLEIADNIQINSDLKTYISENRKTAENLWTLIETKTCYKEWWTLISEIKDTLSQTDKILEEQSIQLEKLKQLQTNSWDSCISNLITIITNNQSQLANVKSDLSKKEQEYKNIIWEKLNFPEKCKWTSFEDTLKKTSEAKKSMEEYLKQQQGISQILANPSPEWLTQLCNWSKNDSQLNENLSNSVSQMMKDLQKQSEKEKNNNWGPQKKDREEKKDWEKEQSWDKKDEWKKEDKNWEKQDKQSNWETEYKDVLNQQEREILNQTEQSSSNLIKQIQQIKWQWNYNWYEYIKNLFNSFMWNEWDLKNLHQENKEESNSNSTSQTQRY